MFEIRKQETEPIVLVRAATAQELSNYEKWKLENIEHGAQANKIEAIEVSTSTGNTIPVSIEEKTAKIALGELAVKDNIVPEDISLEKLFKIECSLDI